MFEKRFSRKPAATQGYPSDGKVLAVDIAAIKQQYEAYKKDRKESDNDVTQLVVGLACDTIKPDVEARLKKVRDALSALKPDDVTDGDIVLKMGPLKKIERIMQKAVHYTVEEKLDTLQLPMVSDILRATIVLPPGYFKKKDIGSSMIDAVDAVFEGSLWKVKNRFIELRYPSLFEYNGRKMTPSLVADIKALSIQKIKGRDTFYRDLQLLVKLDRSTFDNTTALEHVFLELQLVSSALYGAKVTKSDDEMSGHEMYRITRAIMEHCEFAFWTEEGAKPPRFASAEDFYPLPPARSWENYTRALGNMWDLYRSAADQYVPTLQTAIDNSKWYAKYSGS